MRAGIDQNWHHVVGMRTVTSGSYGEESIKLYVDGNLESCAVASSAIDSTNSVVFDIGDRIGDAGTFTYVGNMSHAAIYFTALNASQVLEHYTIMTSPGA
jgi:hypothetical protein